MKKKIVFAALIIMTAIDIGACSFLRRYGANSYITNIPLFFKRQDPEAPQRKSSEHYEVITEKMVVVDKVEAAGHVENIPLQANDSEKEN